MIQALLSDLTFRGFFIVISIVAVTAIVMYFKSKDPHKVENIRIVSPSLVLSLAILGTFVGILHGLFALGSSVGQLSPQQVTGLVSGLKIAFGTSVYGLGVNILLKMVFLLNRRKDLFYIVEFCFIEIHNIIGFDSLSFFG